MLDGFGKKSNCAAARTSLFDVDGVQPSVVNVTESDDDDDGEKEPALRVPYGFWARFMREELHLRPSDNRRMRLLRAVKQHVVRAHKGCITRAAYPGLRKGGSKRSHGGALNRVKAVGLGFALLQYFVNVVQHLQCRADSALLMRKARELRAELLHDTSQQWTDSKLQELIGTTGAQWFLRWRSRCGICRKVIGMKLKVT